VIELYCWTTSNGLKTTISLEAGLPYRIRPVNIGKGSRSVLFE
jgi:GST-like protein